MVDSKSKTHSRSRTKGTSAKSKSKKYRANGLSDSFVGEMPSTSNSNKLLFPFISSSIDHAALKVAVKEYKYISPPKTLLERLYLNTFWDMLAEVYPTWLAPNTITLVGYVCFGLPVIASFIFGYTQGDGVCPNWWILLTWICHCVYQHADGSDGPQARRLKCGSALGELVDHGADAIVTGIFPYAMTEIVGLGIDSPYFLLMYVGGMMAFFTSNMTLLHKQKQEFQDVDAQEAQQGGQITMFILFCYNMYHGVEGRQVYQSMVIPFPPFIRSSQQQVIINKIVKFHDYLGLPTTCSTTSKVPCFINNNEKNLIGFSFVWILVTCSYFSIWTNIFKLISSMCVYYYRNELPKNKVGRKVVLVGRGMSNLCSQLLSGLIFCTLTSNCWFLLNGGEKRDVRFFLPFIITSTWSFGDFANHLLIVRVTRINFPAFYRHRSWLWLIGLNIAMYLKNFDNGMYYEEALNLAWIITILAYISHYSFCRSIGLAIRDALGVQFFTVPTKKRSE